MALNLKRELAKSGFHRKNNKSLVVNKIKKNEREEIIQKNKILFDDPNTFLQLPYETNFEYIINKIPRGPQYDFDDKLIPYTMIGNPKYIKANKYAYSTSSKSVSKKTSFISKVKDPNLSKNNNNNINNVNNYYNIISDKEIKEIFNNYKNKIRKNKIKYKNDLISNNKFPKIMKKYIDKSLALQEKCLKKNEDNLVKFKNMGDFIQQKIKLKSKSMINKRIKNNLQNNSMSKDINITVGELIMNSGEEYRLKNEAKALIERKKIKEYGLSNANQNWEMSLRRPKNFVGKRNGIINFGSQKYPYWAIATERNPKYDEFISKPKNDGNYSSYGVLSSRTNSIQNLFNLEIKKNKTNDEILKNYFKKNNTCEALEIHGKKLIDFEEDLCKKLKGKKKIFNYKNNKEEVKDMTIQANYTYNNLK